MNIIKGKKCLFLTSWPNGHLEQVQVLGFHKDNYKYIYITREGGGTDTTTSDFLFEYLKEQMEVMHMKYKCTHKNFTKKMSCKWYFAGICLLKKHEHNEDICRWEKKSPHKENNK